MALCTQKRGRRRRGDRGMCYFFVHHSVSPFVYPLPLLLLISGESMGNAIRMWGRHWTHLQENKGMVDWQHLQPLHPHHSTPILFPHLYLSAVQWLRSQRFGGAICRLLTQYLFILRPSGPQDRTRRAEPHLICYVNTFCILERSTVKFWHCLTSSQLPKAHLISKNVEVVTFLKEKSA